MSGRRLVAAAALVAVAMSAVACGSSGGGAAPPVSSAVATTTSTMPSPATIPGSTVTGPGAFLGPVHTVPVGSITMSFRQFGSGPDLVLIAGQASPMSFWPITTLRLLSRHWRITMYDNRALGATTDDPSVPLTMERMADDLVGLTAALGLHRPAVFGWSTGGEIALVAAIRHPRALGPLAVSGAMPGGPSSVDASAAVNAAFNDPNTPPGVLLGLLFGSDSAAQSAFVSDLVSVPQTPVSAATTQRYAVCENAYVNGADDAPKLRALRARVLVTDGRDDQLVPPENARIIADLIPGAQLALEPGGHAWFIEHPEVFLPLLQSFFRTP